MKDITRLHVTYARHRNLEISEEQFIFLLHAFPALLVVMSDGLIDRDEWQVMKGLSKILGKEFASDNLGMDKEENLTLIYKGEFRYLIHNMDTWRIKFLDALREYFEYNPNSKEFIVEVMHLFAHASDGVSKSEAETISELASYLGIEDTSFDDSELTS